MRLEARSTHRASSSCGSPSRDAVYTLAPCDVTADAVAAVYERRGEITGLAMTYEPEYLRFLQARFEPLGGERV
jgi:hypothetical protein